MLVHGIVASDRFIEPLFWGRIPSTLRKAGNLVFLGRTDAVGSVAGNAKALGKTIDAVLRETGKSQVLLLAHSKGGIDSQHYIATQKGQSRVAGLVTVCTPHGGSELADIVVGRMRQNEKLSKQLLKMVGRFFPDDNPALATATEDLTTATMTRFANEYPDRPDILYRSYHTRMESPYDDFYLSQTYKAIYKRSGPNDGIVSVSSATSKRNSQEIKGVRGGISHIEMLDLKRRKISGLNIPEIWVEMAKSALSEL